MPPRIRTRASKAMKENMGTENKIKPSKNNTKTFRKALADKTNSASDETSVEDPKRSKKAVNKSFNVGSKLKSSNKDDERPRRSKRVPKRIQTADVINISKSKETNFSSPKKTTVDSVKPINNSNKIFNKLDSLVKINEPAISPFKTPTKLETSLVVSRPRRICRLPSRFDDHFISPSKVMPLKPSNSSTPIQKTKIKATPNVDQVKSVIVSKKDTKTLQAKLSAKTAQKKKDISTSDDTNSPDTNNNANGGSTRAKRAQPASPSSKKLYPKVNIQRKFFEKSRSPQVKSIISKSQNAKKVINKSQSFQVLGGKKTSIESEKDLDVYEFTFDPTEEPLPQKKKRKKPAVKKTKATKLKPVTTYKSIYDQNISKALSALKKAVQASKNVETTKLPQIQEINNDIAENIEQNHVVQNITNTNYETMKDTDKTSTCEGNYPSIRIEDIAADIEPNIGYHSDLNYSPVNSPRPQSSADNPPLDPQLKPQSVCNSDPLNLQEDFSFFDDVPVASSSMNVSTRHPLASPWRVEFGSLPIKWHSNTYVKPNMTPAVESSFICVEESDKKKHVYTNIVPETNEPLPQILSDTPDLKQTSIISFIKEVAEKKAKQKRGRSVSPSKAIVEFNNLAAERNLTTVPPIEKVANNAPSEEALSSNVDTSNEIENLKETKKIRKRRNNKNICDKPAKSPRKQKDKDGSCFGFNDSDDQENVSPWKTKTNRGQSLRPRTRAVLQEINGPTRAALPVAAKSKIATSSEAVNKVYEELKSAADAPVFVENADHNVTNIEELSADDSQSVHLFEDIDVVHYIKPTRKSYGKAKKVTFRQPSDSESSESVKQQNDQSSFEDDLGDLTFEFPDVVEKKKTKKKKPKKLMSKKEEKEAEEWAAGFNSMCEEIEEFPLMVE